MGELIYKIFGKTFTKSGEGSTFFRVSETKDKKRVFEAAAKRANAEQRAVEKRYKKRNKDLLKTA